MYSANIKNKDCYKDTQSYKRKAYYYKSAKMHNQYEFASQKEDFGNNNLINEDKLFTNIINNSPSKNETISEFKEIPNDLSLINEIIKKI